MTDNKTEEDLASALANKALDDEALDGEEPQDEPGPEAIIAALEAERDELRDRLMRALAEAENIRKRAERDRKDAEAYGGTKLARDVLAVHDNLGRAMASMDEDLRAKAGALIEGVELTQRELLNAFAKHKIGVIHPEIGEKFNAQKHQAMFEAPVPHARPGSVIQVMQDGFMIAERLLRPAMVGVAAAGSGADLTDDEGVVENG
ncbi:MAG: molecular chaperone GrpE [Paracoccaceae bacterium]|jgi:molecular chaperone GrpE